MKFETLNQYGCPFCKEKLFNGGERDPVQGQLFGNYHCNNTNFDYPCKQYHFNVNVNSTDVIYLTYTFNKKNGYTVYLHQNKPLIEIWNINKHILTLNSKYVPQDYQDTEAIYNKVLTWLTFS